MFRNLPLPISLFAMLSVCACDGRESRGLGSDAPASDVDAMGRLSLTVTQGPVGILARTSASEATRLVVTIRPANPYGAAPAYQDTFPVSDGQVLQAYWLSVDKLWKIEARGLDANNQILSMGQETFALAPDSVTRLEMRLHAASSRLQVRLPVFDEMTRVVVTDHGTDLVDTAMPSGMRSGDTMSIAGRTLSANGNAGAWHSLGMKIYGRIWNKEYLLFKADTSVSVVSGVDMKGIFRLVWVGPDKAPDGMVSLYVQIEQPANTSFDVVYPGGILDRKDSGNLTDTRTGQRYDYKRIGNQVWMLRNIGAGCDACDPAGTKFATMQLAKEACPIGWHLPAKAEWEELVAYAAQGAHDSVGMRHLRSTTRWGYWRSECDRGSGYCSSDSVLYNGDDQFGFSLVPNFLEVFGPGGGIYSVRSNALMWTSTPGFGTMLIEQSRHAYWDETMIDWWPVGEASVRCVRD